MEVRSVVPSFDFEDDSDSSATETHILVHNIVLSASMDRKIAVL